MRAANLVSHGDVSVAPTSSIALDAGVTKTGLAVLVGEPHTIHATTIAIDGATLIGDGAIRFAYGGVVQGSLVPSGCSGDCADFQATTPGDGEIVLTASSSSAKTVVALHSVTAIDSFTIAQSSVDTKPNAVSTVAMAITARGAAVWTEPSCTSDDPNVARAFGGPLFGPSLPSSSLNVVAMAVGSSRVTCMTAGLSQSFTVNVK